MTKMKVKGAWFAILYLIPVIVFLASCKDDDEPTPEPVIASFSPTTGALPGSTATITGQNFSATPADNAVQFNGVTASVTAATATQLTVTVPQTTTGKITVTVQGKTATSAGDFIILIPPPVLTDFSPKTGRAGTAVTITGTHLGKTAAENTVKFNGVTARVTQASETSLTVIAPGGGLTGKITVTVNGQEVTSTADFEPIHTIHVGGHSYDSDNQSIYVAEYWKDGELMSMTDGTANSTISDMDVVEGNVYLAGTLGEQIDENNATSYAVYWKNGTLVKLTNGSKFAEAKAITVVGDNIYVAGEDDGRGVYWKNGVATYLTDGTRNVGIEEIVVSGNDVYVVGYEDNANGNYTGKYWKNGVGVNVGGEYAFLSSVLISGSDVYITGYMNNYAYYWKNGVAHQMPGTVGEAAAWDMAISGNDIYVVGRDNRAVYWKNDTRVELEDGTSANSICIIGNDLYIAGEDSSNRAKYWKNGEVVNLTDEESGHYAAANTIVVK